MEPSKYRYCTSFFVEGDAVDPEDFEAKLSELGDSLLVVGAPGAVKAHVHTDEPGRALALATAAGEVEEVDIKNMHVQTAQRTQRLEREAGVTGAVAVVVGNGNRRLFESLGAVCVDGGETMNPSTADIAAAIESLPDSGAIVLPNSKNVVMAAERAADSVDKDVRVVPTHTLQAGLGALVAYDAKRPVDENAIAMAAPLPGPPGALRSARSRSSRASSSASWKGSRCRPAPHSIRLHARSSTGS
jgi:dihydroxyacetone kinase-like predicted kinase